jgi:GT2 family glycosyltransferase
MTDDGPVLSVVVPTHHREELLVETLNQLADQTHNDYEVHVADHTEEHDPETKAYLADLPEGFEHHELDEGGLCEARNHGIQVSRGKVVLFVDDDVRLDEGFLAAHTGAYDDSAVGAVAGQVRSPHVSETVDTDPIGRVTWYGRIRMRLHATRPGEVEQGRGCNMSFRRDLLEAIGGFDTELSYRDESDAFYRIRELGYIVRFVPEAGLYHREYDEGGTVFGSQRSREELREVIRCETYFHLKNLPRSTLPFYLLFVALRQAKRRRKTPGKILGDGPTIVRGIADATMAVRG